MALPTSYTEADLSALMAVELGATGTALGLTDGSDALDEAVNDVAAILDAAIADVTDVLKLRTVAKWQAWTAALNVATGQYDLGSEGDSLKRSQLFDQIMRRLALAEAAASRYSEVADALAGGATAYVSSSSLASSPYAWASEAEF